MGLQCEGASHTESLKSASDEVCNWNLINEVDYEMQLFAVIPKDNVYACRCHGRHAIDSRLGTFDWSMKLMLGGVHPVTRHYIKHLDVQMSLLVGRPLVFSCGLVPSQG